jgi:hypothetical protein
MKSLGKKAFELAKHKNLPTAFPSGQWREDKK